MKQIDVFIVDDERNARDLLRTLLVEIADVNIVGEANSVDEAFRSLLNLPVDLIFLDIQMPRKDGFELVELIKDSKLAIEIIFVTAYEKYAIKAMRASAFDYLLKPVKKMELENSIKGFKDRKGAQSIDKRIELLINLVSQKRIKINDRTGFQMIAPNEIVYCIADSNYSKIFLENEKELTTSLNLGKLENVLNHKSFVRISRSVIININYLVRVDRKNSRCTLQNNHEITLSLTRKYMNDLESRFIQ